MKKINNNYILTKITKYGDIEILPEEIEDDDIILDALTEDGDYI